MEYDTQFCTLFTCELWRLAIVAIALIVFGVSYNALVAYLERHGRERGYTAFLVAFGNLVTVGLAAFIIGMWPALIILACFALSGLPMIIGSMTRFMEERETEQSRTRQQLDEMQAKLSEWYDLRDTLRSIQRHLEFLEDDESQAA